MYTLEYSDSTNYFARDITLQTQCAASSFMIFLGNNLYYKLSLQGSGDYFSSGNDLNNFIEASKRGSDAANYMTFENVPLVK